MPLLEIRSEGQFRQLQLETLPVPIGRHPSNAIRVEDGAASRRHGVVEFSGGVWRVRDLGSRNGIKVNGARVANAELRSGDEIRIGKTEIHFVDCEDGNAASSTSEVLARYGADGTLEIDLGRVVKSSRPDPASVLRAVGEAAPDKSISSEEVELPVPADSEDRRATQAAWALLKLGIEAGLKFGATAMLVEGTEESARVLLRLDGKTVGIADLDPAVGRRLAKSIESISVDGGKHLEIRIRKRSHVCEVRRHDAEHAWEVRLSLPPTSEPTERLARLGTGPFLEARISAALRRRGGLILVSGTIGSGVRTTLSVLAREVESREAGTRIMVPGGYSGLNGPALTEDLEAAFAREPDVLAVGCLEDPAAARKAQEIANRGILVIAGIRAPDAAAAITALLEFGVPASGLAASLQLVLAQRLVRRLCRRCVLSEPATAAQVLALGRTLEGAPPIGIAEGCDACLHTGYLGRLACFELLERSEAVRDLILQGPTAAKIRQAVEGAGHGPLRRAGLDLVCEGATSFDELDRLIPETPA